MSWTYDSALPTERDQVRFLIQDNNTNRQLFQDSEITWSLTTAANIYTCAADLCDILVAKAGGGGGIKSKKVGDLSITYDVAFYRQLSGSLRSRGYGHQVPYAGGISVADKQAQQADSDATVPSFSRDQSDNPAAPKPSRPSTSNPLTTI